MIIRENIFSTFCKTSFMNDKTIFFVFLSKFKYM